MSVSSTVKLLQSPDGTTIFAEATGDPKNVHVVLVSGLSLSGCVFDGMCADQRLFDALYIVRYDLRGHGRSGKPDTAEAYESKMFAADFKTVMDAFKLHRPVFVGWSLGAAVATDVVTHLPPHTLSGIIYLAGVPDTTTVDVMAAPALKAALPGLMSADSVASFTASADIFVDACFSHPDAVPYAVRCVHAGHRLSADIMHLSLTRPMALENLWKAGKDGLPLVCVQGTDDGHRAGSAKSVDEIMHPHFTNYEMIWLEGRGHALHAECPNKIVQILIKYSNKFAGKANSVEDPRPTRPTSTDIDQVGRAAQCGHAAASEPVTEFAPGAEAQYDPNSVHGFS
ncbi:alpha/beta-hydrolase [Mycena pura]|uniref:Alpha/beta-hydrolase n=1 Tax=Mycena pura TaxID=153505 RepID=A0AAD6YKH6_9AGAR|nr:alpha/beta-hydrolase [Mycena pura]